MARKTDNKHETRQHILDGWLCVCSQQGVSSTSLAQVLQTAGVTRGDLLAF
jgi:hypothetical protein